MRTKVHAVPMIVLFLSLTIFSSRSLSQSISSGDGKIELGLGIGPSFFLGDLGGTRGIGRPFVKDVNFPYTKLMKGLFINYYPAEWLGFRIAANLGTMEAHDSSIDSKGGAEHFRKERNLGFKSKFTEAYAAIEFYPTVFFEKFDGLLGKIRPYGLIGFGMFHYNPQGLYINQSTGNSRWVDLKPLRLEGQGMAEYPDRKEYSLTQQEIPMGFGAKFYIRENMYVGLEVLHRLTFTDYIDDVSTTYIDPALFDIYLTPSQAVIARQMMYRGNLYDPPNSRPYSTVNEQRGDPTENDAFFSGILRFGWRLNGANDPNTRARKQMRCPVFY
jgi:hypothetical protein